MPNLHHPKSKVLPAVVMLLVALCNGLRPAYAAPSTPPDDRPNIIFILTDDMGFSDIGCFGGQFVPTPNIDRLANSGRKFTQYYSAAPICSPSSFSERREQIQCADHG